MHHLKCGARRERRRRASATSIALVGCLASLAPPLRAQEHPGSSAPPSIGDLANLFRAPEGTAHRVSSTSPDPASNTDFLALASGAEIPIADLHASGVITRIWITAESDDPYYPRLLVLRAKWDGESMPSIEVPIGDFFGVGNALEADVNTEPVRVAGDGRARNCYWPMPFNDSAYVTLRNDSGRPVHLLFWSVDWIETKKTSGLRTLHAQFRASPRDGSLRQHKVVEIKGAGHYVGTVLSMWSGEEGWPGEGDDRFFIDGRETPTLQGTGLEDYFGDAWGLRVGQGPYGGVTVYEGTGAGARLTACRWHLRDPIPFAKGLAVTFERMGWAMRDGVMKLAPDRKDAISSVGLWYQEEPHGPMSILPTPAERLPFFEVRYEPEEKEVFQSIVVGDGAPAPTKQQGAFWAYGAQVAFAPTKKEEAKFSFPFDVPSAREYDLYVRCTRGPDEGCWQAQLDDEPIGSPMDLYSPRLVLREQLLGRRHLKPGGHTFALIGAGKNLESTGLALGLDSFMVRWLP